MMTVTACCCSSSEWDQLAEKYPPLWLARRGQTRPRGRRSGARQPVSGFIWSVAVMGKPSGPHIFSSNWYFHQLPCPASPPVNTWQLCSSRLTAPTPRLYRPHKIISRRHFRCFPYIRVITVITVITLIILRWGWVAGQPARGRWRQVRDGEAQLSQLWLDQIRHWQSLTVTDTKHLGLHLELSVISQLGLQTSTESIFTCLWLLRLWLSYNWILIAHHSLSLSIKLQIFPYFTYSDSGGTCEEQPSPWWSSWSLC